MPISDLNLDAVRVGAQRSFSFAAEHANGREYLPEAVFDFFDRDLPAVLAELEQARMKLAQPCGSCHPCENYGALQDAQKIADDNDRLRELLASANAQLELLHQYGAGPMDMFLVRYNGIRTVSLTCDCTWQSAWSALPVHLTTLIEAARRHLREAHQTQCASDCAHPECQPKPIIMPYQATPGTRPNSPAEPVTPGHPANCSCGECGHRRSAGGRA